MDIKNKLEARIKELRDDMMKAIEQTAFPYRVAIGELEKLLSELPYEENKEK